MNKLHKKFKSKFINLCLICKKFDSCRSSCSEVFCKKDVLRNFAKFTGKHLSRDSFLKKQPLAKVFSCEFCEIPKNTFFYGTPPVAASGLYHRSFPVNFAKFLWTPFIIEHLWWLLLFTWSEKKNVYVLILF